MWSDLARFRRTGRSIRRREAPLRIGDATAIDYGEAEAVV